MKFKLLIRLLMFVVTILLFSERSSAQLFWDQACSFAGTTSSYISVKNSSRLDITGSFTMEVWINPVNATSPGNQNIFQKRNAGATGYAMTLSGGRIMIRTNNTARLIGNMDIPSNTWTHVAARYNSSNGRFSIYINSELDSSVDIAGAAPVSNSDSLWIGKGGSNPFQGQMDNIRIWDEVITPTKLTNVYRSIIATNSGIYDSLVLSLPFQGDNSSGTDFTLKDFTSHDHLIVNRGITGYSLNSRPSVTTSYNESVELRDTHYVSGADNINVSPTSKITLEAWVYPELTFGTAIIIHKGASSEGAGTNYQLALHHNGTDIYIKAIINGILLNNVLLGNLDNYGWGHIAFTYNGATGIYEYFLNGEKVGTGQNSLGNITDGSDSLYIGGVGNDLTGFRGYIDEVRITNTIKSIDYIDEYLFKSIDDGNDSAAYLEAIYNFDGYLSSGADSGPKLNFRNGADFSHPASISYTPETPLLRASNFHNGYYISKNFQTIGTTTTHSLPVNLDDSITDVNVFVALNHSDEADLRIILVSPDGDSGVFFAQNEFAGEKDNLVTVFDDEADSLLINLNRYVSITPKIKPLNNLNSIFTGTKTKGTWVLKIIDYFTGDYGKLYSWGIQFNNQSQKQKILNSKCFIQGFYNNVTHLTTRDTITCNLRNIFPPYSIVASSKSHLQNTGNISFAFNSPDVTPSVNYYIQLNHRNSIETWSSGYFNINHFTYSSPTYDFSFDSLKTFDKNVIRVDYAQRAFAIYSGDVNQDGVVDATDAGAVDNDAANFLTGYVTTDVTGNDFVDASDAAIIDNNAANFVTKATP